MNKNPDNPAQVCHGLMIQKQSHFKNAISLLFKPVFPVLKKHDNFTFILENKNESKRTI